MAWTVRPATAADRAALAVFRCDSGTDCPVCGPAGGNVHEREVEDYLRRHALDEMDRRRPHNGHTLLLVVGPDGELAAAAAHERFEVLVRGAATAAERLVVAAVRVDLQGTSTEGHSTSSHVIGACVQDLEANPPELLVARVAVCNVRSRRLLARHKIDLEVSSQQSGYVDLAGAYDEVVSTLPPPLDPATTTGPPESR